MLSTAKPIKVILIFIAILFCAPSANSRTKKLKRPSSRVGISSVDKFVKESFDLYDKVYMYDGYAEAGKPLSDEDIDVLENALDDVTILSESAPDIIGDLDGVSVLKQGKATLQLNRAKKALKYSIKTSKKLLTEKRDKKDDDTVEPPTEDDVDESSNDSSTSTNRDNSSAEPNNPNVSDDLEIYSKYDFVPGDKQLFFDDFSNDFIGDFPSKWNTNGGGEVVSVNNEKWFEIISGYGNYYIPDVKSLPEEYTIEFDVLSSGLDKKTSATAMLHIYLSNTDKFSHGTTYAKASLPFCQYISREIRVQNYINRGGGGINNGVQADIRKAVLNQPHIAIAVNKQRYRVWVNQKKYIDVPRMLPTDNSINYIKFHTTSFKDGKERLFIKNLKVAEGGLDLRRTLIDEGKVSTNGILFDSGSANIQPQSLGIVRQISQVLMQDQSINLLIVGHTDADGGDDANMKLSKDRAEAIKIALVNIYKTSEDRLTTDGKGESLPVADNTSTEGKSQNRRVEFIKQ